MDPKKVSEILASGGTIQQPLDEVCPACSGRWNATHMLVIYEGPEPKVKPKTISDSIENRERRQLSILLLEMAEEFFLRAHQWVRVADGSFQPPPNYRFRKNQEGHYDRSHAVNSQKQVYNPLFAHEKQWEGEVACGRTTQKKAP